ncbi:FtsQ-type POTRA domain-containing protein [Agrococcus carbonis]|uniref:Cell division septal protein FtsQ n=1 Tax=Agrococcus carbonis TaxID=684552 RepID=A0A1H1SYC4_9MICO|nr:FtsQ-type POTRA domain-containing protein [Agrococcus carbonis]SDS53047.1 Cell division septal protein FtsQ [Agrococcus carbonis]
MKRPEGFDEPPRGSADAARAGRSRASAPEAESRGVVRLDALRRRREAEAALLERWGADASGRVEPEPGPEPRRWALSAYADLEALDEQEARGQREDDARGDGEVGRADADVAPTEREEALLGGGSNAQRVDRAWRRAEQEQRRLDRAELRDARREARLAKRARVRQERAEVRRFTAARRRQLRMALLGIGGLGLALALLVGLVWSPLMAVRDVQVEGADRVDPAAVQQALAGQVGQPIATVTEAGVAEQLRTIPQIESFQLDVVPPSTVIVRLVERRPVAILPGDDGETVIDGAGVALGAVDESTAALPRLEGVEVGSEQFEAVAAMLVAVPVDVLESTETVEAPTASDIRLTLESGQTVQWGGADESPLKAAVLAALMATQDPAAAAVLDVRAPEHPVVRSPSS